MIPPQAAGALLKPKEPVEGERPLTNVDQMNKALESRYQILHPGGALPPHFTLPANATQKDYDRIDKALEGNERALGTKAQQDAANTARNQAHELASTAQKTAALDRETTRFTKPHEKAVADANAQLEKIDDARAMINGSAEAQALGIPKVLTALVSGAGSGVRITQPELNAIAKARGITGDVEGFINSISGKGKLTSTQQKQLTDLLDGVKARITQKQSIANDALDNINGASSRDEIIAHDKDARQKISDLESGKSDSSANMVKTQAQFDALPKGATYTGSDGKQYRKP